MLLGTMAFTLNASMHKQRHTDSSLWSTKQAAGQPELHKLSEKREKERETDT